MSPQKVNDITGAKFGALTVLHRAKNNKHGNSMWECLCECGTISIKLGSSLNCGHTKSCGCLQGVAVDASRCLPVHDEKQLLMGRKEARRLGVKFYYTGRPCSYGHRGQRYACWGGCVQCVNERARKRGEEGAASRRALLEMGLNLNGGMA